MSDQPKQPKKEYVIWGKPIGADSSDPLAETLLVSEKVGLTSRKHAEQVITLFHAYKLATDCRVQEIDGTPPDFVGALS